MVIVSRGILRGAVYDSREKAEAHVGSLDDDRSYEIVEFDVLDDWTSHNTLNIKKSQPGLKNLKPQIHVRHHM